MTPQPTLASFDPCPPATTADLNTSTQILAIDVQAKYLFVDQKGETYHEYHFPASADIHNCGGYVDKLIKYRDPALLEHLRQQGISQQSFDTDAFPILRTRSPQFDLVLFDLIQHLRTRLELKQISLFDLGCTVAEHWDLLDAMIKVTSQGDADATRVLSYCGLDKSAMLLTVAKLLHSHVPSECFQLIQTEGSTFDFANNVFDLSLSVGVVNHVAEPVDALIRMLRATRYASVIVLWITAEEEGYWSVIHSGLPFYFFSLADLSEIQMRLGDGQFLLSDYVPETQTSQHRSFISLAQEKIERLASCRLVYSKLTDLPIEARPLLL